VPCLDFSHQKREGGWIVCKLVDSNEKLVFATVHAVRFCSSLLQDLEVFLFVSLRAPIGSFLAGQISVSSFQADLVFRCLPELKIHPTPAGFCLVVVRTGCSADLSFKSTSPGQLCLPCWFLPGLAHQIPILPPALCRDFSFAFHFLSCECLVLWSRSMRSVKFSFPAECAVCFSVCQF
jgi:hypothetical protein